MGFIMVRIGLFSQFVRYSRLSEYLSSAAVCNQCGYLDDGRICVQHGDSKGTAPRSYRESRAQKAVASRFLSSQMRNSSRGLEVAVISRQRRDVGILRGRMRNCIESSLRCWPPFLDRHQPLSLSLSLSLPLSLSHFLFLSQSVQSVSRWGPRSPLPKRLISFRSFDGGWK